GPGLCHVHRSERTRRVRDAEPGVPLRRGVRADQHPDRPHHRLARPEDPLPMTVAEQEVVLSPAPAVAPSRWTSFIRGVRGFVRRSPLSAFWAVIVAAILFVAVAAPAIAPYQPLQSNFRKMSKPPDEKNWFGTDQISRDTLSRVIHGSRASL